MLKGLLKMGGGRGYIQGIPPNMLKGLLKMGYIQGTMY